nr:hypothetical protein [Shewanella ferrihydritica]
AGGGRHGAGDRKTEEVESTAREERVSLYEADREKGTRTTHPILIMIKMLVMATTLLVVTWRKPSFASKYPYLPASVRPTAK